MGARAERGREAKGGLASGRRQRRELGGKCTTTAPALPSMLPYVIPDGIEACVRAVGVPEGVDGARWV